MPFPCPACQRSFDEPGFCPYDGTKLDDDVATGAPTILTANADAETMAPDASTPTRDGDTNKVRAVSASTDSEAAIDELRDRQHSEYDLLVGETLDGRYYVQRKIGEGGMGVVFAAKHAVIERPLAIKVLKREVMRDTATIRRFVQEAKAASRIGHPNIVDVTDFGTTPEGMTYSVMEYVDGTTLSRAIKHGAPFPPERAIRIASQIARALGAAHDKGIVHRDLKPENVFLIDRDARPDFVKIVDFGIAKVQPIDGVDAGPRLTRAGSVFGTPEYMAPEQASGRGDTDRRVDIYALGTILYEMIVGQVPHKSDSMIRTIAKQMLDVIKPPSQVHPDLSIHPALEAVIMKALAKQRDERYQTMPEMLAALDDVTVQLAMPEPTISLAPLPPGADPDTKPSLPPAPLKSGPRRSKPETRPLHEPEFVVGGARSLQHMFDDEPEPEHRRRWPLLVLGALVIVAGGVTVVMIASRPDHEQRVAVIADAARADTVVIAQVTDAGVVADAAIPRDASVRVVEHPARDAGVGAGVGRPHPGGRMVTVEVLARPGEVQLWDGATFRGPSGTYMTERLGTTLELECRAKGYKGKVTVVFDGKHDNAMCTALKLPRCVGNLKPFNGECVSDSDDSP